MYRLVLFILAFLLLVSASLARDVVLSKERFSHLHSEGDLTCTQLNEMCHGLSGSAVSDMVIEHMDRLSDFSWGGINGLVRRNTMDRLAIYYAVKHAVETRDPRDMTLEQILAATNGMRDSERCDMALVFMPRMASRHLGFTSLKQLARRCGGQGMYRRRILEAGLKLLNRRCYYLFEIVPLAQVISCRTHMLEFLKECLPKISGLDIEVVRIIAKEMRFAGSHDYEALHFIEAGLKHLDYPKMTTREYLRLASTMHKSAKVAFIEGNLKIVNDLNEENVQKLVESVSGDSNQTKVREAAVALM